MFRILLWLTAGLVLTTFATATPRTLKVRVADGFDFPVGKPDGQGYYKYRGFSSHHPGDDWNGGGGGNSDLGDPVYSIGHGIVVLARDMKRGWGNSVIVRHAYREGGKEIRYADSLYTHLDRISVREGEQVLKGKQVGTIGTNRGMYAAHLHFEVRKNLAIGMNRSAFARDLNNYFDPTRFIQARRKLKGSGTVPVETNTFSLPSSEVAKLDRSSISGTRAKSPESNSRATSSESGYSRFRIKRLSDREED